MPILVGGQMVVEYDAVRVVEYVDKETGEIYPASEVHRHRWVSEPHNFSELALERASILSNLRPEVREFADFVLLFRDGLAGVAPNVGQVVEWYAALKGTRASNERRKLSRLEDAGILSGELVLPPFQILDRRIDRLEGVCAKKQGELRYSMMRVMADADGFRSQAVDGEPRKVSNLLRIFRRCPLG